MIRAAADPEGAGVDVNILDFRVIDRVLAETDPDAADVVFMGARGTLAFPFVVVRRLAGPGGVYIDACDVVDADGRSLGIWEKTFELDGESKPCTLITELRDVSFPGPGTYTLQYFIFDDVVGGFPFQVVQADAPAAGIVPGPLDAALAKSTIAWLTVTGTDEKPIWYGYENGRIYVLAGGEGEQQIPGLTEARTVRLAARSKDKRSLVAEADCAVDVLEKNAEWDRIARDLLIGRRLNLRDGDKAADRWKETCEIACLTPLPPEAPEQEENAS